MNQQRILELINLENLIHTHTYHTKSDKRVVSLAIGGSTYLLYKQVVLLCSSDDQWMAIKAKNHNWLKRLIN